MGTDQDVIVAKNIAQGEGYFLQHINKMAFPQIPILEFENLVKSNYYDLDLKSNLFSNRSDLITRMTRSESGGLLLNGSGGEIYRDVWKWDFKKETLYDIFRNSYDIGHLRELNIDVDDFFQNIERKMKKKLSPFFEVANKITRQQAEFLFPIYRSNFYYSANTINNYFGYGTYPFMSQPVVLQSFSIPYKFKRYGEFERLLIKRLNPRLASYMSAYGFGLATGPTLKNKAMERGYSLLPPGLKTKIKSMTSYSGKSLFNGQRGSHIYMEKEYLGQFVNPTSMRMSSYISNIQKITNQKVLERIYTFEFFSTKNSFN